MKIPPAGTRGTPYPRFPGWLASRMSRLQRLAFRRRGGGHTQGGLHPLLLESIGAKSGEPRTAMLGYVEEPGGSWLVVASLAGAARHPAWLYNLAKRPEATIEFGDGRPISVRADALDGVELEEAWKLLAVKAPEYVRYRSKTDREIPVVRLRPR
ncbi:MAG: nitroreductase/quinone reductase family protein [Candidatus Limnocylindria bacterium]